LSRYKHIIWDWNGTLMDDVWLCVEVINGILKESALPPIAVEDYRTRFQFPVIRYYETLGFDVKQDAFEKVSLAFINGYDQRRFECELHPEVTTILQELTTRGLQQSILSAYTQDKLNAVIEHYGIRAHFQHVVGIDNIYAAGKLEQGIAHMRQLTCAPHETLLVGDTLHDHEVAQAIGADCILISHGHNDTARLAQSSAPVIERITEIAAWL